MIRPHHQEVINRLTDMFKNDPRYLALIVGGSVAKGTAGENSDVDVIFVVADDEWERRKAAKDYFYLNTGICGYPDGYVDGKHVNLQFIRDAADHGSEPARWAFTGAFTAYSHVPELDSLVARIPVYQDQDQQAKLESFYCQTLLLPWFISEGEKRRSDYLIRKSAADMVFYSARLVLAHNKMLFPYHKWLMTEVEKAPNKPASFKELADALLSNPTSKNANSLCEALRDHYGDHGIDWNMGVARFIEDNEWNWLDGKPPLADW